MEIAEDCFLPTYIKDLFRSPNHNQFHKYENANFNKNLEQWRAGITEEVCGSILSRKKVRLHRVKTSLFDLDNSISDDLIYDCPGS